jgi:hypothetical protein
MPKSPLVAALLVPLGLAALAAPAAAQAGPPGTVAPCGCPDVNGTYGGTWGATTLRQEGAHVTGRYAYQNGAIDGQLDGDTLHFTWTEDDSAGRGVFRVVPDGTLVGTWGMGDSETSGGDWVLTPSANAGASGGAPTTPTTGWIWGLRFPWDVQMTPHNISMGVIGVTLDVGERVAGSRWYIGGSASYELEADMTPPEASPTSDSVGAFNRLRVGGEARVYFGEGTAALTVNDGDPVPVPRHDWLGLRGGAESFDGFSHTGEFADLTFGWDADLGGVAVGMTLTGGASVEPSAAFPGNAQNDPGAQSWDGTPTTATTPATYVSPYIEMGIHLVL